MHAHTGARGEDRALPALWVGSCWHADRFGALGRALRACGHMQASRSDVARAHPQAPRAGIERAHMQGSRAGFAHAHMQAAQLARLQHRLRRLDAPVVVR
eukprot:364483-Chlamydomonas_euryale.AAC.3